MPRLLVCKPCSTMYKLRDFEGSGYDAELDEIVRRHLGQAADSTPESHESFLIRCDQDTWDRLDAETEVKRELMRNEVEIRHVRDDLKVEALKCFGNHMRPKGSCIDYKDESKTIGRKTGIPKTEWSYLCEFCPVHEYYVHKVRKAAGLYDLD